MKIEIYNLFVSLIFDCSDKERIMNEIEAKYNKMVCPSDKTQQEILEREVKFECNLRKLIDDWMFVDKKEEQDIEEEEIKKPAYLHSELAFELQADLGKGKIYTEEHFALLCEDNAFLHNKIILGTLSNITSLCEIACVLGLEDIAKLFFEAENDLKPNKDLFTFRCIVGSGNSSFVENIITQYKIKMYDAKRKDSGELFFMLKERCPDLYEKYSPSLADMGKATFFPTLEEKASPQPLLSPSASKMNAVDVFVNYCIISLRREDVSVSSPKKVEAFLEQCKKQFDQEVLLLPRSTR